MSLIFKKQGHCTLDKLLLVLYKEIDQLEINLTVQKYSRQFMQRHILSKEYNVRTANYKTSDS